jgi:hypothetical protein
MQFQTTKTTPYIGGFCTIISWLERIDGIKTFDDDPLLLEQDIVDIKKLLEDSDKLEGCSMLGYSETEDNILTIINEITN